MQTLYSPECVDGKIENCFAWLEDPGHQTCPNKVSPRDLSASESKL